MATGVPSWLYSFYDRFVRGYPRIQYVLNRGYQKYLDYYMRIYIPRNCVHQANASKRDVIWVDTDAINEVHDPGFKPYQEDVCPVMKGDWDQNLPAFEDVFPYHAFEEHFIDGVPWEQTEMYPYLRDLFNKGKTWHGCGSFPEVTKELEKLDELYSNIKNNGYRTQREILESNTPDPLMDSGVTTENPERGEVTVDIARTGKIVLEDGRHRVAIAKLLGLKQIPVRVLVRHTVWQQKRKKFQLGQNMDHPDIGSL